jgi:glycosyltransferase involved in cell wall biosynthesis
VTILYSQGKFEQGSKDLWSHYYRSLGISLEFLPESTVDLIGSSALTLSVSIYFWLRGRSFDVVHLHEMNGCGYHTLAAKHTGLAFAETLLCVGLHGPASWHRYYNKQFVCWNDELTLYWMEQASLRLADVAFSPSQYLFTWAQSQGWELPERCWVMPHPLPKRAPVDTQPDVLSPQEGGANWRRRVAEIVFFGRLESRKGLELFCDALELLEEEYGNELRVAFIGKPGLARRISGLEYLEARVHQWQFAVTIEPDLSRDEALDYLSRGAKLVVIPSLADSTSYTLYECLQARLPLLCADDTGLSEILHPEDSAEVLFAPNTAALSQKLRDVLENGATVPRAIFDLAKVDQMWQAFHNEHLFGSCHKPTPAFSLQEGSASLPLVSVCITHHDRPQLLEIALDSVASQSYSNIEVIVIDDGSSSADIDQELARIEKKSAPFPVRIVRGSNRFPGASRNIAGGLARGEFILFFDDDNVMKSDAIAVLVKAALTSGAQIVSPWCDIFTGSGDPRAFEPSHAYWLLAGPALSAGAMSNVLARSQFAGCSHAHVPEALIWYRRTSENFDRIRSYPAAMRRLRPYGEQVSDRFFDVLLLTNGMEREVESRACRMELSSPVLSQERLRAAFHASQMILFSTHQSHGFAALATSEHMQVSRQDNELEFTAVGNDPQIYFPELVPRGEERLIIRIKMTASKPTFVQVFYKLLKQEEYQEERSVIAAIPEGVSEVFLPSREPNVQGVIRLDPAGHEGEYIIHSIEMRGLA